jgi:hypothetical protein
MVWNAVICRLYVRRCFSGWSSFKLECGMLIGFDSLPSSSSSLLILISALLHDLTDGGFHYMSFRLYVSLCLLPIVY